MQWRFCLFILSVSFSICLQAQPPSIPKYYFRNPLGIPMQLAANFGELRPNHWHMGLDIRTDQKENLPVYAAAGGYIAHIGIRSQSFGRYIIINHPNGLSTLYAHLNDFYPALEQYVSARQYKQETWAIEIDFDKQIFPVAKGQFIAFSGNTGGSQGPHLHFEIRDTKTERCLNPSLFYFSMEDNVPPNLVKLALYDRSKSVYEQIPAFFTLKNTDSGYIIPKPPVIKTGLAKLSFAIQAYDRATGSSNPNGIYSAKIYVDDDPVIGFRLDSLDYDETLFMNAQVDYKYRYDGGAFLQHLSQLSGDHGVVYKQIKGDGVISLADTNIHAISIEVKDAYFNTSQLNFAIQFNDSLAALAATKTTGYAELNPVFAPGKINKLEKPDFEIYLAETSLYDSIHPLYYRNNTFNQYAVSALHQVNDASIPIHDNLSVRIRPAREIPEEWKDKLVIVRHSRNGNNIRQAMWEEDRKDTTGESSGNTGWLKATFGDLGTFQAFIDTVPPEINGWGSSSDEDTIDLSPSTRIVLQPRDNFSIIKNFRAELDPHQTDSTGQPQWLRFTNDKNWSYIYDFDEHCPFGIHQLKVSAEDLVGNTITRSWWFKRYPYTPPKKKAVKKKKITKKK